MPHLCPRSCSRLASAAVFISVGVVQFVVGIILLRSKYVFLLAGPDFWTSVCNIAVGCLLGVSASVWKQSSKRPSKRQEIRRNVLLALLFSGLIMNATTLGILLLGEGNTLLAIRLESKGKYTEMTFVSEILAYAYVTSVCCPVVCIVVCIVSMSGNCFSPPNEKSSQRKFSQNSWKRNQSRSLQWIYTPENLSLYKKKARDLLSMTLSDSSTDDEMAVPVRQKQVSSIEDLQNVLSRMAQGKRDSILSDSAIMLRQLDQRRKNRYHSGNQNESYMGPILARMKESAVSERSARASSVPNNSNDSKTENSRKSSFDEVSRLPQDHADSKHASRSRNKKTSSRKSPYAKEFMQRDNISQLATEHSSSQCCNYGEILQTRPEIVYTLDSSPNTSNYNAKKNTSASHKQCRKISEFETKKTSAKYKHKEKNKSSDSCQINCENRDKQSPEESKQNEMSEIPSDCFSPDESEFSPDSPFEMSRSSSWAGEIIPINIPNSSIARLSEKLIPVASPVVPNIKKDADLYKHSDDSGINSTQSSSFSSETSDQKVPRESNLSSFRESPKLGSKENVQEYPKAGSTSVKKYDLSRVVTMASISEEPHLELSQPEAKSHSSSFNETTPKIPKEYHRQQSLPALFKGSSEDARPEEERLEINGTPKRKKHASTRVLRKLWSISAADNQTDFLDQVVDNDSLIGLSEEELIERQLKNRSIRKVVQKRIKEGMLA